MRPLSMLYYGGPGAGKTELAVSSFWDFKTRKQIRRGRLLSFGRETNPAVLDQLPPETVIRFTSPSTPARAMEFVTEFRKYMDVLLKAVGTEQAIESIVFDGFSEWNAIYQAAFDRRYPDGDKWAKWEAMKREFINTMQLLDPESIGAYVLGTARVDRFKKPIQDKKGQTLVQGDADMFSDFKYIPQMSGWTRDNLGHYFNFVLYMEEEVITGRLEGDKAERRVPQHLTYMLPVGDFWIKNSYEREWLRAKHPDHLTNISFDGILDLLTAANAATTRGESK